VVPIGSPRNYLGTGQLIGAAGSAARENMWLSVAGYCAANEHGDRITPAADNNGTAADPFSCNAGNNKIAGDSNPSYVRDNPTFSADGYFYAIDFPAGSGPSGYKLDLYDAPNCQFEDSMNTEDSGANSIASPRRYQFILRNNDNPNPALGSIVYQRTIAPTDCATMAHKWWSFQTLSANLTGSYFLQVVPVVPTNKGPDDKVQEGNNQFAIRVSQPSGFVACTNDQTTSGTGLTYLPNCPKVYARTNLGVYAAFSSAFPLYFMASVGSEHAGKTMEVELFDPAEGADAIELLDPRGNPVQFRWEVACKDDRFPSESGACTTGEAAPTGGYGNQLTTKLDVSRDGTQPWTHLTQTGKYSDRVLRLKVTLPANYGSLYGTGPGALTWWKIRYSVGASVAGDRTTWTVRIKG
jgi:hypothetical protein